ncbi:MULTISPECIES: hypothetical protein [unclassified Streptomyces]|uniref:hypothetical protein n=1 Tax=unclassified Streptomyces TaxID=2593676 RepID=UPI001BE5FE04|nr:MULTISPECIES: hypothetical protein [unclassified Streptomyces]MBT2405661.1 hypothetical protein [Streptomyces sp. ISL-21]MBT2610006.1 hypothetical protein [Streptomyces sp. ISL-87]
MSILVRNVLVLAVEFGAVLLLRGPDAAPWIPALLAVFVVGSGVLHGTEAEFVPRFLVALAAVGVARLGSTAWGSPGQVTLTDEALLAGVGAGVLLVVQTVILVRFSLRRRRA